MRNYNELKNSSSQLNPGDAFKFQGNELIYMGTWEVSPGQVVHAALDSDFLKDSKGKQLLLDYDDFEQELAKRNQGRPSFYKMDKLRENILNGAYKDGDLAFPPEEFISGKDQNYKNVRDVSLCSLLRNGSAFRNIKNTIDNLSMWKLFIGDGCRNACVVGLSSSKENSLNPRQVYFSDGSANYRSEGYGLTSIVPFRVFRKPPQLNL